ncbi:MAG: DNA-binding protein WhiA [Candidatus Eremiobacteraeota bacterium]|nr:DNA-binding protein WhiA [Candidatus Eremiobacteraeota bacterium]
MTTSSLSGDTKDALARDLPEPEHCRAALLNGLACYSAGGRNSFQTQRLAVARLFWSLLDRREDLSIQKATGARLYRIPTYHIELPSRPMIAKPILKCDRRMEVRAAFLACGSLSSTRNGYHLEFSTAEEDRAARLARVLTSLGHAPKRSVRKRKPVLYYKNFDAIADLLSSIGAFHAVLQIQEMHAFKETKNRIHRLVNSEAANAERAATAGATQRRMIHYLLSAYGLRHLDPPLREIAQLRLAHPEETLAELGKRCNPPAGKSTVNGRITRLIDLTKRLQNRLLQEGPSQVLR